jgi:hypothetical protein
VSTAARRGEAHLWLLLEEALVAAGRGGAEPWDVQRHFRYVADAMATAGVVPAALARHLEHELDDALVVRRLVPAASFFGADPDEGAAAGAAADQHHGPVDGAVVWLEAEIERHLDLLADFDAVTRPDAGADTLRIVAAPARAFEVAGVLGSAGRALLDDLAASVLAAGFDAGRAPHGDGRVRRDWVRFLRDRPPPLPASFEPDKSVHPRTVLGTLADGRPVRVDEVAWTAAAVSLTVTMRGEDPFAVNERVPIQARILDPRGHLHLGQPTRSFKDGGTSATFLLRPGLEDGVANVQVRVTSRGRKVEGTVAL